MKYMLVAAILFTGCAPTFYGGRVVNDYLEQKVDGYAEQGEVICARVIGWTSFISESPTCWCTDGVKEVDEIIAKVFVLAEPEWCEGKLWEGLLEQVPE